MFEDIDNASRPLAISRDSDDRTILYAIWTRDELGVLPVDAAWEVLHERYPEDARMLLVQAFEELGSTHEPGAWSPGVFLGKLRKVLDTAGGKLNPQARDLLAVAEDDLHPLSAEDTARLDRIRARVGARVGDAAAARKRLVRFASDLVRELHDKTSGGRPIAARGGAAAGAGDAWKRAVAEAKGPKRKYAADAKVSPGDVVEHPKFGVGVVTAVEPGRAHVLFESGSRKLVAG